MPSAKISIASTIRGQTLKRTENVSGEVPSGFEIVVPAAKTGTLTLRTDNDTGQVTLAGGHGVLTGDKIDLFWTESGVKKARSNMTVGTVATNVVPVDGGVGDNLPPLTTALTAHVPVTQALDIPVGASGANLKLFTLDPNGSDSSFVVFEGATVLFSHRALGSPPEAYIWASGGSFAANPLATATAVLNDVAISHGDSTKSVTLYSDIFLD